MRMPDPFSEGNAAPDVIVYPVVLVPHVSPKSEIFHVSGSGEDPVLFFVYVHKGHCIFA